MTEFEPSLRDRKGRILSLDENVAGTGFELDRREFVADALWGLTALFMGTSAYVYRSEMGNLKRADEEYIGLERQLVEQTKANNLKRAQEVAEVARKAEEEKQKAIDEARRQREMYLTSPPEYSAEEPDEVSVTRLVYSETRSEYKKPIILKHKACSVVNRSKERGLEIKDVIFEDMQYKALRDRNSPYFYNPSNFTSVSEIDLEAWQKCYEVAESILKGGVPYKTTHTFLEKLGDKNQTIPKWVNTLTPVANIKTVDGKGLYHFLTELA